jgi:membrane AbrB-like protein
MRIHLRTLAAAVAGGAVAAALGVPLGWMIGAMVGVAAVAWRGEVAVWDPLRAAALLVLGLGLGQTFDAAVLAAVGQALPALAAGGVIAIAAGIPISWLFMRLARVDQRTGFFCAVPGGIVVMAVLAQRAGVPIAPVTLAQTLRMVLVVLVYPPALALTAPHVVDAVFAVPRPPFAPVGFALLAGASALLALLMRRAGFANPWMLGPTLFAIALAASVGLPSGVPAPLVEAAQIGLGAALGQKLTRRFLLSSRRLAIASVLSTAALMALLAAVAFPLAWVAGLPPAAVVLGLAPGGMPEMAMTAKALDLAVPLVLGFHLVRVILSNLLVGPMWRLAVRIGLVR